MHQNFDTCMYAYAFVCMYACTCTCIHLDVHTINIWYRTFTVLFASFFYLLGHHGDRLKDLAGTIALLYNGAIYMYCVAGNFRMDLIFVNEPNAEN